MKPGVAGRMQPINSGDIELGCLSQLYTVVRGRFEKLQEKEVGATSKEPLQRLATQIRLHRLHDGTIFFRLVHAAPQCRTLQRSPLFTA